MEDLVKALDIRATATAMPMTIISNGAVQTVHDTARDAERRRGNRIRTVFRVAKVVRDRAVGLWRIRNISDFGMMLLTRSRLPRGEQLTIELSSQVAVDGRVVWSNEDACGIAFDTPIDSAAMLSSLVLERSEGAYRPPRAEASIRACVYGEDGLKPITISDVSQQGLGFRHAASFEPGVRVRVLFEGGLERRGIVRWAEDQRAGLELFDPLSCEELELLLSA